MVWNHFEHLQDGPKGRVQDVLCKMPLVTKILNRTKRLILGSLQMCPSNFRSNGVPRGVRMPFALKISLFVLKL